MSLLTRATVISVSERRAVVNVYVDGKGFELKPVSGIMASTSPLRCGGRWGFSGSPAGAALRAPVPNGMAKRALAAPGSPLWRLACLAKAQDLRR